jgi:hypothetical protein
VPAASFGSQWPDAPSVRVSSGLQTVSNDVSRTVRTRWGVLSYRCAQTRGECT